MDDVTETLMDDAGGPSQPAGSTEDLVSTVDEGIATIEESSEETLKTKDSGEEEGKDKKESEAKTVSEEKSEEKPSRFQQRITKLTDTQRELKDSNAQLQRTVDSLKAKKTAKSTPDYKDIGAMAADKLLEWQEEDPQGYARNLAQQLRAEVMEEAKALITQEREADNERREQADIERTFIKYAKDNDSFNEMWDTGELQEYMEENPGHNAISAHQILTADKMTQQKIDDAVTKALEDVETKTTKNKKAKQGAKVLGSGPTGGGHVAGKISPELKDTKKFGGLNAVLAARSAAREAAQG